MKIFEDFIGIKCGCIVCGTTEDKPSTLLMIKGTRKNNKAKGYPVHVDCLNPVICLASDLDTLGIKNGAFLAQVLNEEIMLNSRM